MDTFNDWFEELFLPYARKLDGKKVIFGDNLASHLSMNVIQSCKDNQIEFVCLPANSTHILQPLDVGLYGPMKKVWSNLLAQYKRENPADSLMNKCAFQFT